MDANIEELKKSLLQVNLANINVIPMQKHAKSDEIRKSIMDNFGEITNKERLHDWIDCPLYCFGTTPSEEFVSFCVAYFVYAIIVDEQARKFGSQVMKEVIQYMDDYKNCHDKTLLGKYFLVLLSFVPKGMEETIKGLWEENIRSYQVYNKVENFLLGQDRDEETFWYIRELDFGVRCLFWLARTDSGLIVTQELANDQDYIEFNKSLCRNFILGNELFSLKKEVKENEWKFNYVYLKLVNNKWSPQQTVDYLISDLMETQQKIIDLGKRLKLKNNEVIDRYAQRVTTIVFGGLYYESISKRYK